MISNIKTVIELIRIILDVLRFLDGTIDEVRFTRSVKARKKLRDEYLTAEEKRRLDILSELQK